MRIIPVCLCFFYSLSVTGQFILEETDTFRMQRLAQAGVRSVTAYEFICSQNGCPEKGDIHKKLRFDRNGNITGITTYENSEVLIDRKRDFLEGKLISETVFKKDSFFLMKTTYSYNGEKLTEKRTIGREGTLRYLEENKYDDHNGLIFQRIVNRLGDTTERYFKHRYAANDLVLQTTELTRNQTLVQALYYTYDSAGRKTEVHELDPTKGKVLLSHFKYDDSGNPVLKELYTDGKINTSHWFYYNKNRITGEKIHDYGYDTDYIIERKFNKYGVVEEFGKYELDTDLHYKFTNRYNCKGLEKETRIYDKKGEVKITIRKKYNRKGNLTLLSKAGKVYAYQVLRYEIEYF